MSLVLSLVAVAVLIIWVISIFDIVRRRLDLKQTAGWSLLVVLLPVVGSLIYWTQRPPTSAEVREGLGAEADLRHARQRRSGGGTRFY
jgi:NADH:ubiquinone oxidoreductase subunit 6 (subunit J)